MKSIELTESLEGKAGGRPAQERPLAAFLPVLEVTPRNIPRAEYGVTYAPDSVPRARGGSFMVTRLLSCRVSLLNNTD